jgi:FKBP-type peptidyl-prolyl cis-trans isomerase
MRLLDSARWHEALMAMVAGETRRIWVQGEVVDVELLDVYPMPRAPALPDAARTPPRGARTTASGLRYTISGRHPRAPRPTDGDVVAFNQTTWTADGQLVTSSYPEGMPQASPVSDLWEPWKELLSLMHVGEKARFWLSEGGAPDGPGRPIVGELELLYVYANPESGRESM